MRHYRVRHCPFMQCPVLHFRPPPSMRYFCQQVVGRTDHDEGACTAVMRYRLKEQDEDDCRCQKSDELYDRIFSSDDTASHDLLCAADEPLTDERAL